MERKRYLELCQQNAVYEDSVLVLIDEAQYHPIKLEVWFDKSGRTKNTAVLLDKNLNSIICVELEKVCELK